MVESEEIIMELLYESKTKNLYGNTMLLEKQADKNFYGFRWKGESLRWGYNVSNCGTKEEVLDRCKGLIKLNKERIEKYHKEQKKDSNKGWNILIDQSTMEINIYIYIQNLLSF